jgi:hypothetical protein
MGEGFSLGTISRGNEVLNCCLDDTSEPPFELEVT